jgi:uncharacterized damage-inducible protein DinB
MEKCELVIPEGYSKSRQQALGLFAAQLDDQLTHLKKTVEDFALEHLEWQLQPGMNTAGMLLAHIAVCETFWLGAAPDEIPPESEADKIVRATIGIGGNDDGIPLAPDGGHPSTLAGKSLTDYFQMLDAARAVAHTRLKSWADADLERTYMLQGNVFTYAWTVYHVLEHLVSHFGQIRQLRHLMRAAGVLPQPETKSP